MAMNVPEHNAIIQGPIIQALDSRFHSWDYCRWDVGETDFKQFSCSVLSSRDRFFYSSRFMMYFSIKIRKLYESPHKAQHQINHIINIQNISALHTGMEGNFSRKIKQKAIPVQGLEPWDPAWKASMLTTYIILELGIYNGHTMK